MRSAASLRRLLLLLLLLLVLLRVVRSVFVLFCLAFFPANADTHTHTISHPTFVCRSLHLSTRLCFVFLLQTLFCYGGTRSPRTATLAGVPRAAPVDFIGRRSMPDRRGTHTHTHKKQDDEREVSVCVSCHGNVHLIAIVTNVREPQHQRRRTPPYYYGLHNKAPKAVTHSPARL